MCGISSGRTRSPRRGSYRMIDVLRDYTLRKPTGTTMSVELTYCVVLTTTSTEAQADELAKKIIGEKLAACVQIQKIKSYYMWQGESCISPEYLLLIKTRTGLYQALESFIQKHHTYETPEIVQVPITAGFSGYLHWIDEVTGD